MKSRFLFITLIVLSSCAKERTTKHFSTQGQDQPVTDEPITFVLTNEDYEKQQEELKKQQLKKTEDTSKYLTVMKEDFEQQDLSILFQSLNAPETQLPAPEGVICEFIPQLRIQKTIGRLSCVKQSPLTDNEDQLKKDTRYTCTVDFTPNKGFEEADQSIYEALTIPEVENEHGYIGTKTMTKQIGRFHCDKITQLDTSEVRYECAAYGIFAASETKSTP